MSSTIFRGSVNIAVALLFVLLTGSFIYAQTVPPMPPPMNPQMQQQQANMARQQQIQAQMSNLQNQYNQQRANMATSPTGPTAAGCPESSAGKHSKTKYANARKL